ncbi:MAG: ABC transporter permease subunit [Rhizobiaceae bacterium]|nr:ABC transporter permease subunit [Rhizobiaceae bacterium]
MALTTEELRARSKRRKISIQVAIVAIVVTTIIALVWNTTNQLEKQGLTSGFDFLERSIGWGYSFSLIERSIQDTYSKTLLIGFLNTIFVGFIAIILSTIFGFAIGTAKDSNNLTMKSVATIYIQIFRNIPLILQVIFLYAVIINLPSSRQAYSVFDVIFLSNRGLMLPTLNIPLSVVFWLVVLSIGFAIFLIRSKRLSLLPGIGAWIVAVIVACALAVMIFGEPDQAALSIPALKGLRFVGGLNVSIELVTMTIAIVLYGSAYIAEVVRGGLKEVPKGLIEAGQALGLSSRVIWSRIKLPMSLRTIIPPLGNQWIFIMKGTTIGIAIGFSDLFYIVSTSITQSGQTLELIALLAGAFLLVNFSLAQFINWLNSSLKLKAH